MFTYDQVVNLLIGFPYQPDDLWVSYSWQGLSASNICRGQEGKVTHYSIIIQFDFVRLFSFSQFS